MTFLFVASLHHPDSGRPAADGADLLFPMSQAHAFWVKALRAQGHACHVFWRSRSAYPWVRPRALTMRERLTPVRAWRALAGRVPRASLDLRLRNRRLLDRCRGLAPDVVVLVGDNRVIFPDTLDAIRRRGAVVVYACGTSPIVFASALERAAAPLYDLVVANDLYHAMQWRELGSPRVEVLPLSAVDPDFHRPFALTPGEQAAYGCDVGFTGTLVPRRLYGERVAALEALRGFDLRIWSVHETPGPLRPFRRGPLLGLDMIRALSGARIVVNPHGDFMRYGGNMRLFEACGAGALQIVDDRPGVREWFTVGEHLVAYRDPDELRTLVSRYLTDADERRRIAEQGRRHVLAHHTYAHRMRRLVELIAAVAVR